MAHFIFDKDNMSYRIEKKTVFYYAWRAFPYILISSAIATLIVAGYYGVFDSETTKKLKQDRRLLHGSLTELDSAHMAMQVLIDSLRQRDRKVYQMILNADPEEEGDSLSNKPEQARVDASQLQSLEERIATIRNRLGNQSTDGTLKMLAGRSPRDLENIPATRPVKGDVISGYGPRQHPLKRKEVQHNGIDLQADLGTPVVATGNGTVIETGIRPNGQGQYIAIRHAQGYVSRYAHLSRIQVAQGQTVRRGQTIGLSGSSGICKGNHLHYEIWKDGQAIDPIDYFFADVTPEQFLVMKEKAAKKSESMD
jgi:murein DD-endopeptidase MepM/ murein hydrolase activator NlpD